MLIYGINMQTEIGCYYIKSDLATAALRPVIPDKLLKPKEVALPPGCELKAGIVSERREEVEKRDEEKRREGKGMEENEREEKKREEGTGKGRGAKRREEEEREGK